MFIRDGAASIRWRGGFPGVLGAIGRVPWLQRRDVQDAIALLGLALVTFVISTIYDLPLKMFNFASSHADWEVVDDVIFTALVLSVALIIYGLRRFQDFTREVKARRIAEAEARKLALHDPLTGLPNRRFFTEKLGECLRSATDTEWVAVLMLDLDGFKLVNDLHGHGVGDRALIEFATRISGVLRTGTVLTRIGGDEFAIIMPDIKSLDGPTHLAARITAALARKFLIDETLMDIGVSVGIAIAPNDGLNSDELVRRADRALYRAKAEGRACIRFFEPDMDAHIEKRFELEREFRSAVAGDLIIPHYQPLITLEGNRIIGFEALARWQSEKLGFVPPDVFIRLAEELGLIGPLGDQLLRRACAEANTWPSDLTLAFNISATQLREPTFGLRILELLKQCSFDPRRLEIEITESALVDNVGIARLVIDDLRGGGVRIALDDFGTGYATLSQLLSFHLDKNKIDRSFVTDVVRGTESLVLVRAILGLAEGLGLTVTAEGIEDAAQLACLKANGCAEGQGYLFSKAVPAADIPALLKSAPCLAAAA
jgi:diguanylate cyclase (GGDEF)-like protein